MFSDGFGGGCLVQVVRGETAMSTESKTLQQYYTRFGAAERMEHMVLLVSFTMLAVTGLPQRYAEFQLAKDIINAMGGIESLRVMHRFFAILLMIGAIYHGGAVSYKIYVRGDRLNMIPGLKDLWDVIGYVKFNLGLGKDHPKMPRYNFGEKAEYLAVVWGSIIMVITGFMMWNPVATNKFLPGAAIPIARIAHSYEALLAALSIIIWHMYNVHLKRFNRAMFTGKLPHDAMEEEHAEELEAIHKGEAKVVIPPEILEKRKRRFYPYAAVMTLILVAGLYFFVTFEDSSITTVPRRDLAIIAPQEAPVPGQIFLGENLWSTVRCAACHGEDGLGIEGEAPAIRGIEITWGDFYRQVRLGRGEMPAFSRGELSDEYLSHIWAWVTSTPE
jgi:formate dehydrogenase gamma subunit